MRIFTEYNYQLLRNNAVINHTSAAVPVNILGQETRFT